MIDKRRNLPATAEFLMRFGHAHRTRWRSRKSLAAVRASREGAECEPVSTEQFRDLFNELKVCAGDTLLVHSSAESIERLGWTPSDFIDLLLEQLGPTGTLVMPSHPALALRDGRLTYNVRRSPSTVGLLTELFRRRTGASRSAFPFSAAAAIGPLADQLTRDHRNSFAPHDEHSPYSKLTRVGGKSLCIGCPLDRMTLLHVVEDVFRDELNIPEFYEPREVWVKQGDEQFPVTAHVRSPWLWWYLHLFRWTSQMYRRGVAQDASCRGVVFRIANANETVKWMTDCARRGQSLYPLSWLNRWLRLSDPRMDA